MTTASVLQTTMCFYIRGWVPADDVGRLRAQFDASFGMKVVLEEKHVREEDLAKAPVVIMNPPYFRPFEIFGRLLPVPAYSSFDPTPFIGIFFPVFFGMILGDAGYGLLLVVLALFLRRRYAKNRDVADASRVLLAASLYTIIFGVLYGEFFGDLGTTLFGMEPLFIERRTSIMPMMLFALSAGVVHIVLGLLLGAITSFRQKVRREGFAKLLNILIILCLIAVFASFFGYIPGLFSRPIIMVILVATPFLLFSGGLAGAARAAEEHREHHFLCQDHGHRPDLGAARPCGQPDGRCDGGHRARRHGGRAAPSSEYRARDLLTDHPRSRLHYVEFFSKFVESGGKKFDPMHK